MESIVYTFHYRRRRFRDQSWLCSNKQWHILQRVAGQLLYCATTIQCMVFHTAIQQYCGATVLWWIISMELILLFALRNHMVYSWVTDIVINDVSFTWVSNIDWSYSKMWRVFTVEWRFSLEVLLYSLGFIFNLI